MRETAEAKRSLSLVTGGAGFIGSNLVRRLVQEGGTVRVLDNMSNGLVSNLEGLDRVELTEVDIRESDLIRQYFDGVDCVYHLAALGSVPRSLATPCASYEVNVLGSANVFEAARAANVRRVVYASSSSVYGDSADPYKIEGREGRPISPYAASKACMELLALTSAGCYGQDLLGLRFFNVFGPFQRPDAEYAAVVPLFAKSLLDGNPPTIFGDGGQVRDFTYVEDVVDALVLAGSSTKRHCGEALNIAAGRPTTVRKLFEAVRAAVGADSIEPLYAPARLGDIRESRADTSLAESLLRFQASWDPADGLKGYVAWLEHGTGRGTADQKL